MHSLIDSCLKQSHFHQVSMSPVPILGEECAHSLVYNAFLSASLKDGCFSPASDPFPLLFKSGISPNMTLSLSRLFSEVLIISNLQGTLLPFPLAQNICHSFLEARKELRIKY